MALELQDSREAADPTLRASSNDVCLRHYQCVRWKDEVCRGRFNGVPDSNHVYGN